MANGSYEIESLLKSTEHVHVELRTGSSGTRYISKRYRAHSPSDRVRNAAYSYMALSVFKERFADVLVSPAPIYEGAEDGEVLMEYLPELPIAERLTFQTLHLASGFFRRCYSGGGKIPEVETIYDSVLSTPRVKAMIDSGWPLRLGVKCDLFENLRYHSGRIFLADVEGLAYEPYGLSELVLHASLCASPRGIGRVFSYPRSIIPIAFKELSPDDAEEVCRAATEIFYNAMRTVPSSVRRIKAHIVERSLKMAHTAFFGASN